MILSKSDYELFSNVQKKITVVVATSQSSIKCFMLSIFSLLLRSKRELEHFIVNINGPDSRCGSTLLQDTKQSFLEELRLLKLKERDMPITVARTWSRVGHAQSLDSMIPWVHTEYYCIMHDDVIIKNPEWTDFVIDCFKDKNVSMIYYPPLLSTGLSIVEYEGGKKINFPHLNSTMILSRKSLYTELGLRWYGYHVKNKFSLFKEDIEKIHNFYKNEITNTLKEGEYEYISLDIGSFIYNKFKELKYELKPMPENFLIHLVAMSWGDEFHKNKTIKNNTTEIEKLEKEINSSPYYKLYNKYLNYENI